MEIVIGKYRLRHFGYGAMFLINEDDEGMEISYLEIEKFLDNHFKENF